jgi:hypothetical protein
VLDEVVRAGSISEDRRLELSGDVELMETGEDDFLDLFLLAALADEVAAQDFERNASSLTAGAAASMEQSSRPQIAEGRRARCPIARQVYL